MRVFTLILACVLTFGCGCTTERSAQERSYTQDRGDVGQFILQHALAYGARPIKTNGLPALYGQWEYVQDEFGLGIVLPPQYQPVEDFVRAAFGPRSNLAGWSAQDVGVAIMVRKETGTGNTLVGIYPPMPDEKLGRAAQEMTDVVKKNTQ